MSSRKRAENYPVYQLKITLKGSKPPICEYQIMEAFCLSLDDVKLKDKMYYSIKGSGAFRRFKDNIFEYGIEQNWFKYRRDAFKRIAINWCEENNIPYAEE